MTEVFPDAHVANLAGAQMLQFSLHQVAVDVPIVFAQTGPMQTFKNTGPEPICFARPKKNVRQE